MVRAKPEKTPRSSMSRFFLRGLVTLAPVVLTVVVFGLLFQMIDRYVTGPINSMIYWSLEHNPLGWNALEEMGIDPFARKYLDPAALPLELQDLARSSPEGYSDPRFIEALERHREEHLSLFRDFDTLAIRRDKLRDDVKGRVPPFFGVMISILLVLWLGWLVGGFVGRRLVSRLDQTMYAIPVVKSVYPYSKQLVEFFFADRTLEFDTVVAVPYPSKGLWSVGFVTSSALKTLRAATGKRLVSVFVPSSPMPMTGYTVFIDPSELISLPITVDEALRITMTGGVLVPPHEIVPGEIPAPEVERDLVSEDDDKPAREPKAGQLREERA
jgi:uncharacterized membrane protein